MKGLIGLYHKLPSAFWPIAASIQALRLQRRRYGQIYRTMLPLIRERTYWGRERWESHQREQLFNLLDRASRIIPVYRGNPKVASSSDVIATLEAWPLIDVKHFRANPDLYRDPEFGFRNCIELYTSGTSGSPKKIVRDTTAEQLNYAYAEARWKNLNGVKLEDRWVMIGGQLVVPVSRSKPPFWVAAYPMKQLYMSSYHLQSEFAEFYMQAIREWQPKYILGYPSSLNVLAMFSEITGIKPKLECILSNAEPLYDHVRERLKRAFDCDVIDTYGSTEGVLLGFECKSLRMHVSPDFGIFEILRADGSSCSPGEVGKVVVTGLTNRAMPLIRYPIGDSAAWSEVQDCDCGCSFPILERIEGRSDDLLLLPNGRQIGQLNPIFKNNIPLQEAQIIQKRDGSLVVLVVPEQSQKWTTRNEASLLNELRKRIGDGILVQIKIVNEIPRDANGKFRAVIREH